ncbi:hypothetical protein [Sorangium sp. So ce1024]|uniref:hypothetical protein n=1 Tax=Sorangium sp. So ce1024 TaxID=3133327 RepID=UPI003F10E585
MSRSLLLALAVVPLLPLVGAPGWGARVAAQLAADFEAGAKGLKIFKELGRFFVRHQDRVLFGTDIKNANAAGYVVYARFLETEDDYFNTEAANGREGFWMIYGMHLPALRKVYRDNARRLLYPADPDRSAARP